MKANDRRWLKIVPVLVSVGALHGCAFGYNSLLFTTRSNVGVDFEATPPTLEVAIAREEGVLEPTYEQGKTLPVMSSFRPESRGITSGNVGQTFAVGDAAVALAVLYDNPDYAFNPASGNWETDVRSKFDGTLQLDQSPVLPGILKKPAANKVRPVSFGTATSLGVRVSWSGLTAQFPDSFHLGYRRKELAIAPINYGTARAATAGGAAKHPVATPSLLATIDVSGNATTPQSTSLKWLQYFATGKPATALALRRDVRAAMLKRLDPNQSSFQAAGGSLGKQALVSLVYRQVADHAGATGDSQSRYHQARLDGLAALVPSSYSFARYDQTGSGDDIQTSAVAGTATAAGLLGYDRVRAYWSSFETNRAALEPAIANPAANLDGTVIDAATRTSLLATLAETNRAQTAFENSLQKSGEIIASALDYYLKL